MIFTFLYTIIYNMNLNLAQRNKLLKRYFLLLSFLVFMVFKEIGNLEDTSSVSNSFFENSTFDSVWPIVDDPGRRDL